MINGFIVTQENPYSINNGYILFVIITEPPGVEEEIGRGTFVGVTSIGSFSRSGTRYGFCSTS